MAASLRQFDRLDLLDPMVKATAMHRQIRAKRNFFFGALKNRSFRTALADHFYARRIVRPQAIALP